MKKVTHKSQQQMWDEEHKNPKVLLQMDSADPSSGVVRFYDWLKEKGTKEKLRIIELGCGKGRNVIWLAKQGFEVVGLDFSPAAIKEAKRRAKITGANSAEFIVHDATKKWPFEDKSFDVVIDCFATTDIEPVKYGDDPKEAPELKTTKALGLVDFLVIPHFDEPKYQDDHFKLIKEYTGKVKLIPLNNEQTVLVEGEEYKIVESKEVSR